MKKLTMIGYSACFFAICAVPLAAMPFVRSNAQIEKKELSPMPVLWQDGSLNTDFSTQYESWYQERFPFRAGLLSSANLIKSNVFASPSANVVTGKNGYLFFSDTINDFMQLHPLSERRLCSTAVTLSLIEERVEEQDGRFLFAPMPNKASVYGEYMPECYQKAEENNLSRLYHYLDLFHVNYADMKKLLTDHKEEGVYHKRDTHWNYLGAFYGFDMILNQLEKPHKTYGIVNYTLKKDWIGDLDKLLYPSGGYADWQYYFDISFEPFQFVIPSGGDPDEQLASFMSDKEENDTRISTQKTVSSDGSSLYMVRDSFGRALLPYMIDNYDRAMFVRTTRPELSMVQNGSDMIYEIVERNLALLTETAPFMFAPEREGITAVTTHEAILELHCSNEGYAYLIYGMLPNTVAENGRVYIKLKKNKEAHIFEAFPICEQKLLNLDSDYGFSLMLDPAAALSGEYDVTVIAGRKEYISGQTVRFSES